MRTITTNIYTINEHPNPDLCFDWMRDNCPELSDHGVYEMRESIAALSECIGGVHDYQFGAEPRRDQFVSFRDYDVDTLMALDADDCSLTGNTYDYSIIKAMQDLNVNQDYFRIRLAIKEHSYLNVNQNLIRCRLDNDVFTDLHSETEYIYSDEGLTEWADMAELEFTEDGTLLKGKVRKDYD